MLATVASVERTLTHYTDPLQPRTGSCTAVPRAGATGGSGTAFHPSLLANLEERAELRRRLAWLEREEAIVLFRWYVEGATPHAIAAGLGRSLRCVYRRRSSGIEALVALGRSDDFEDADVSEFAI